MVFGHHDAEHLAIEFGQRWCLVLGQHSRTLRNEEAINDRILYIPA